MRPTTVLVTALLAGVLAQPLQATPREPLLLDRLKAARSLEHADAAEWTVSWDERTGAPEIVAGSRSRPLTPTASGMWGAARDFVMGHSTLFRLRPGVDDLTHSKTIEMAGIRHIHLEQTYRGLPVLDAGYNVAVDAAGRVVMITGSAEPDLEGDVSAFVPRADAERRACESVPGGHLVAGTSVRLAVRASGKTATPVYEARILGGSSPEPFRVLVDARTGSIVDRASRASTSNWAFLDPPYPSVTRTDGSTVGSLPQTVSLSRLNGGGTMLRGQYVNVYNLSGNDLVTSSSGDFGAYPDSIPQDSLDFAQVHAYYWSDGYLAYVHSLGYGDTAHVNVYVNNQDNTTGPAYTIPYTGSYFSREYVPPNPYYFTPNVAYDGNTVAHEIQHDVTYRLGYDTPSGPWGSPSQPGALQEGISEYLASSYTNDPGYAVLVSGFYPTCGGDYVPRSLSSNPATSRINMSHYNDLHVCQSPGHDDHTNGLIIGSALWDLRGRIGATKTDKLVLGAIPYLPAQPSMACLMQIMLNVDVQQNGGENMISILYCQLGRGLRCTPNTLVDGPAIFMAGDTVRTYTAVNDDARECPTLAWNVTAWQRRPHHADPQSAWTTFEVDTTDQYITVETQPNLFDLRALIMTTTSVRDSTEILKVSARVPLSVTIVGPDSLDLGTCPGPTPYSAVVSGHGPFVYHWLANGNQAGSSTTCLPPSGTTALLLQVTDPEEQSASNLRYVTVYGHIGDCGGDGAVVAAGGNNYDVVPRRKGPGSDTGVMLAVPVQTHARLEVCDIAGRRVTTAFDGELSPGSHELQWQSRGIPSGVYFYRLVTPAKSVVRRFALIR